MFWMKLTMYWQHKGNVLDEVDNVLVGYDLDYFDNFKLSIFN